MAAIGNTCILIVQGRPRSRAGRGGGGRPKVLSESRTCFLLGEAPPPLAGTRPAVAAEGVSRGRSGAGGGGGGGSGCPAAREASVPQLKEFKISTRPCRIRCWISFARHRLPAAGRWRWTETGFRGTHGPRCGPGTGPDRQCRPATAPGRGGKGLPSSPCHHPRPPRPPRPPPAAPAAPAARGEARAGAGRPRGGRRRDTGGGGREAPAAARGAAALGSGRPRVPLGGWPQVEGWRLAAPSVFASGSDSGGWTSGARGGVRGRRSGGKSRSQDPCVSQITP